MEVLLVGAGVIGTVYGTQLAAEGHQVSVHGHGPRTTQVSSHGLAATDTMTLVRTTAPARVADEPGRTRYDLVLISVRADQLSSASGLLRNLPGTPVLLFFGNNPAGRTALPKDLPGRTHLGFPGVGGSMAADGTARYVRISRQPTTLETGGGPVVEAFQATLSRRGFAVSRVSDMDGWLAYHGLFVGSVAAALYRCHGSAAELAEDRPSLTLMCRSIEEGFAALKRTGTSGLPGNLRTLHRPFLRPVAVRYWARTMRSPMGELCFAAHSRRAEPEMRALAADAIERTGGAHGTAHLRNLLAPAGVRVQ
jgi:2-dehydropantoate 2-reductase